MTLFALPFIAVGIGMSCWCAHLVTQHIAMRSWTEVPATITGAELKTNRTKKGGTRNEVVATYDYQYDGRPFTGKQVSLAGNKVNFGSFQRVAYDELKRHLDQHTPFHCYVDPEKPIESVLYRELHGEPLAFFTVFAALFGSVGMAMFVGALAKARRAPARSGVDAAAEQPWHERSDWAAGKIRSTGGAAVAGPVLAAVALFWNIAALPLYWKLYDSFAGENSGWRWFALAFPTVGVLLLLALGRQIVRARKFGESTLELASTPGIVGGQLAGLVRIANAVLPADGFHITLTCLEKVPQSKGKEHELVLWQDERLVMHPIRDGDAGALGTIAVPVLFAIPFESVESSRADSTRNVIWLLDIWAKLPGVDYSAQFEVPVFKTSQSRRDFTLDERLAADFSPAPPREAVLADAGITEELLGDGVRLVFPPARNLGSAFGLTAFLAIWIGAIWLMIWVRAPFFFPIVFGLFGLIALWIVLDLWLYRSEIEATNNELRVHAGWLGIGRSWSLAADEIERFATEEYMSSSGKQWKNIVVFPRAEKRRLIAKGISSKLAQDAVIDELNAAMGRGQANI